MFSRRVGVEAFNASQRGEVYGNAPAMSAERFAQHVERNAIDLERSPRWTLGGALSAVALLGFRGKRAWVGGFGVVPDFRGCGLAQCYMQDVLSICRDSGAATLELEVLVRNAPAVALYKRCGFAIVDELVVWSRAPLDGEAGPRAACARDESEIARMARTPSACWQREPPSVAAASPCERIVIGNATTPRAYAFFRREVDRAALLDAGAFDAASAELLLAALEATVRIPVRLLNEPAHGPLHDAVVAKPTWTEMARQHRMWRTV